MKRKDYLKELRDLSEEGLREKIKGLHEERMRLRFRKSSGQLDETHRIAEVRVQLAQANTILQEKAIASAVAE